MGRKPLEVRACAGAGLGPHAISHVDVGPAIDQSSRSRPRRPVARVMGWPGTSALFRTIIRGGYEALLPTPFALPGTMLFAMADTDRSATRSDALRLADRNAFRSLRREPQPPQIQRASRVVPEMCMATPEVTCNLKRKGRILAAQVLMQLFRSFAMSPAKLLSARG